MKFETALKNIESIEEVEQVLMSAGDEGTYITPDIIDMIRNLLNDYRNCLMQMDVVSSIDLLNKKIVYQGT